MSIFQRSSNIALHEMIQAYFDSLYGALDFDVREAMFGESNEIYGELYYYSVVKLLNYLKITEKDHFLDIGSGLGRLVFQIFLITNAASVTGIEINNQRYELSEKIKENMQKQLPNMFNRNRILEFLRGDFLTHSFDNISIIYVCSTVFSFTLLNSIGEKINCMNNVQKIISLRKIPNLSKFKLGRKLFLQGTWDNSPCYIYTKEA